MLIFDLSQPGRRAHAQAPLPGDPRRFAGGIRCAGNCRCLPEVSELDAVRHYTAPVAEKLLDRHAFLSARLVHDEIQPAGVQRAGDAAAVSGAPSRSRRTRPGRVFSRCMHELQEMLRDVTGMAGVSLAPMAGAQGEFAGVAMIRAYHHARGDDARNEILVPDAAHGTNPATAAMCGYTVTRNADRPRGQRRSRRAGCRGRTAHGGADADQSVDAGRVRAHHRRHS